VVPLPYVGHFVHVVVLALNTLTVEKLS
jgi:hypothetical protein